MLFWLLGSFFFISLFVLHFFLKDHPEASPSTRSKMVRLFLRWFFFCFFRVWFGNLIVGGSSRIGVQLLGFVVAMLKEEVSLLADPKVLRRPSHPLLFASVFFF